jgi:Cof subfamily protein (haloacid dehalogenase superfamily)
MKRIPSAETVHGLPRPRVAFFDLDGTVVNAAGVISTRVKESVRRLKDAGLIIAIASGRPWFGAREQVAGLGATGASLFYSGALLADPVSGEVFVEESLEIDDARAIVERCRFHNLYFEWYTAREYFTESESMLGTIHAEYLGHPPVVRSFPAQESSEASAYKDKILKIVLMLQGKDDERRAKNMASELPQVGIGSARGAAHPEILFTNFTSPRARRDQALNWLLAHYGVSEKEVISIGDAESDLPFLSRAGWSIAMGSAPEAVRNASRFVTGSVEEDGAAVALEAIVGLIQG